MKNGWRSLGLDAALIVLLTVVVSLPAMRGGFIWDDDTLITRNRMIKASDGLYRFWFTAEAPDYRPLTWSLWWLEWRLWGDRATGYHVVNVLLHAVNAVLVWLILRRLNPANAAWAGTGAWLAAAVFAIHPVNVATVAWISEQKNTLSMLFYALAVLLYLQFDEVDQPRQGHFDSAQCRRLCHRGVLYALSLTAGLLALLSKTAVVMLPVVLLGCVWWRHGRVRRQDWLCTVPYFVASLVLSLVTIVQHQHGLAEPVRTGGFPARLAAAGWIPWFYLSKTLLPVDLMVIYPKWEVDVSRWVSYVPGAILIGCLIVFWWKRQTWGRPLLFGLGYFVVTLFPVLGFFDQGFYRLSLVADHWQYYSIVGVIALAVAGGQKLENRMGEWGRYGAVAAGAAVLMVLGVTAWSRGRLYENSETLWRDNLKRNPGAWPHYNLGCVFQGMGRFGEAIGQFEQALRLNPDMADAHNNLGISLSQIGRVQEAISHYEQTLQIRPNYADAHNNLGIAFARLGRMPEAIEHWKKALQINPDYAAAHNSLGNALTQAGKLDEAIWHYEQALRVKPDYAEAHNNLAVALAQAGNLEGAIWHLEQVLRLKPDFPGAQHRLARLRARPAPLRTAQ